jgi:hypothetical protein
MVGQMLQFQQASPLVNVALGLMGVQTPLVCLSLYGFFFLSFFLWLLNHQWW